MCKLRNNSGFTLLEILIAMTILSIGLLGVAGLTFSTMRGNIFTDKITTATTLAQDQMENIKRLGYANAGTAAGTPYCNIVNDNIVCDDSATNYPYRRVTTVATDTPAAGMKTVTIRIEWNPNHSVTLRTILAE